MGNSIEIFVWPSGSDEPWPDFEAEPLSGAELSGYTGPCHWMPVTARSYTRTDIHEALKTENERLRAALDVAANRLGWASGIIPSDTARDLVGDWAEESRKALNESRKALNPTE